ncbi:MAG: alpha amylase catalytic domain-containing protein [Ignavibacteria bacterium]|nr:MAG: alpha amylase catalytic domain-containing protein [Ignavibacteria bacterium]KAF0158351.1 MAG: alpha amylase catalytic domain-containing protein [Ignavibacteria bacterium]
MNNKKPDMNYFLKLPQCLFPKFPKYEFHISAFVRRKYEFADELFSLNGNVVFANFASVRAFVQKLNSKRTYEEQVGAGMVNAAGLLDEIYHYVFRLYEVQINPGVFAKALANLKQTIGEEDTNKILLEFVNLFPPSVVYKEKQSPKDYLKTFSEERSNSEVTLEELILLFFANFNPANKKLLELFDQNYFENKELFRRTISILDQFFQKEKKFGPDNEDMFTLLKAPILRNPENIEAQIEYINEKWGILLDEKILRKILSGKDLIKEDIKFESFGFGGGAPTAAPVYKAGEASEQFTLGKSGYKYALDSWKDFIEPENFTQDIDWMPRVVLLAKNSYVWLDQLSKKYNRTIKTLNQVPDEELDQLALWGFNGLWLIGIWERSSASKKIKHKMGNIDAVASAYSLYDYQVAYDLGGDFAYNNLNERARTRGIRLASDMVPNHTGIFSKWITENPNYFIQSDFPPFPNYTFHGPDLSDDPNFQIRIEDGYWRRSDAAVVFQRINNNSGEIKYIYHGNDGTNMPWNDTAQLNMLSKEVREAVIQKIFDVARKFSIIRFDAAMTLTKRHFSRLWYPEPGKGGDIPSRSDFALTNEEFDQQFPAEFWREVVDRINANMPETLLLAEAFWLLEGYFVRSLGMHRVYNSAFMNMMMKEENEKYRDAISNTLEFEPEILKRYVNFMSNPDEETAIKQFGSDDKYFGVCTVLVTLPGLPMFGHGQIEGYTEKYGMEYQRAYYHETPNQWMIERHEREIFPLMKKRYLFSQVSNFWLFDFINGYANIDENVFAYTNMEYGERAIVFYNNKFQETSGTIFHSSPKLVSFNDGSKKTVSKTLAEVIKINGAEKYFYIFREQISSLEFIRSGKDIVNNGFGVSLGAFKYKVYVDFKEIIDINGDYEKLSAKLNGSGVASISHALIGMKLEPVHNSFETIFNKVTMENFVEAIMIDHNDKDKENIVVQFLEDEYQKFLNVTKKHFDLNYETKPIIKDFEDEIISLSILNNLLEEEFVATKSPKYNVLHKSFVVSGEMNYRENSLLFLIWLTLNNLSKLLPEYGELSRSTFLDKMHMEIPVSRTLRRLGRGETEIYNEIMLLGILLEFDSLLFEKNTGRSDHSLAHDSTKCNLEIVLNNERVKQYLGVNEFEGIVYYSKEKFDELINWMFSITLLEKVKSLSNTNLLEAVLLLSEACKELKQAALQSGYKLETLVQLCKESADNPKTN